MHKCNKHFARHQQWTCADETKHNWWQAEWYSWVPCKWWVICNQPIILVLSYKRRASIRYIAFEDFCLQGCETMWSGRHLRAFQMNELPLPSQWKSTPHGKIIARYWDWRKWLDSTSKPVGHDGPRWKSNKESQATRNQTAVPAPHALWGCPQDMIAPTSANCMHASTAPSKSKIRFSMACWHCTCNYLRVIQWC